MSQHIAQVLWQRASNENFIDNKYSRAHQWNFDGGINVAASPSPLVVPAPYSVADNVDPEEAFIVSLSSCHMLFFLTIAAKQKFIVDEYIDDAIGVMSKNEAGKVAMTTVTLRPKITFSGALKPTRVELESMHHQAHEQCFIANSVNTKVVTEVIM
ncbi:OsmC family protein [Colwellia asteriadis]|uniref:OsmC family protein n=1 Tax=Colwellia asteriadis TaxID=517723 RepID=A0ABN1L3Q9_9GAMM